MNARHPGRNHSYFIPPASPRVHSCLSCRRAGGLLTGWDSSAALLNPGGAGVTFTGYKTDEKMLLLPERQRPRASLGAFGDIQTVSVQRDHETRSWSAAAFVCAYRIGVQSSSRARRTAFTSL